MSILESVLGVTRPEEIEIAEPRRREILVDLRAVVLLSGSVGTTGFAAMARRAPLTLPVSAAQRLFDCWMQQVQRLSEQNGIHGLPVQVLTNVSSEQVGPVPSDNGVKVRIEQDPVELRGTAGLLRDVTAAYEDDSYIAVANAAQLMVRPLADAIAELASLGTDVAIFPDDRAPGALMLIRCGCLRAVPRVGFVDMKEQALPAIARNHRVGLAPEGTAVSLPIRTAADYIQALRWYLQDRSAEPISDPFGEQARPVFQLVEDGAHVHASARLHDSVVLTGATVERGATLVRSVVCDGGVVRANQTLVDRVIRPSNT